MLYDDDEALFSAIIAGLPATSSSRFAERPDRHGPQGGGRRVDAGPVDDRATPTSTCCKGGS